MARLYTKRELKELGWATIGDNISYYKEIFNEDGIEEAYSTIEKSYMGITDLVYRGLLVFVRYGMDTYYYPEQLK